jgi:hypothetical protein
MSIDNVTNQYFANINEDLNIRGNSIFKSLVEDKELYVNKLPESIFVNYFLPCFMGKSTNPNWMVEWITISGTPASEVRIVKDGTDETLFYVPPILNLNNFILPNSANNLSSIFTRYEMYNRNLPMEGVTYLHQELESKKNMLTDPVDKGHMTNWISILQRYGIVPPPVAGNTQASGDYLDY